MLWNIPSECQGRDSSKDVSLGAKKFLSTHNSLGLGVERSPDGQDAWVVSAGWAGRSVEKDVLSSKVTSSFITFKFIEYASF